MQSAPVALVVPPSAPTLTLPAVLPSVPPGIRLLGLRFPLSRLRLGGHGPPQPQQKPTTVQDKKLEPRTKYRTDTPGSTDPIPKAKPAQPSQPTLPLAEPDGVTDDSEELIPDRPDTGDPEAESEETRYYFFG